MYFKNFSISITDLLPKKPKIQIIKLTILLSKDIQLNFLLQNIKDVRGATEVLGGGT